MKNLWNEPKEQKTQFCDKFEKLQFIQSFFLLSLSRNRHHTFLLRIMSSTEVVNERWEKTRGNASHVCHPLLVCSVYISFILTSAINKHKQFECSAQFFPFYSLVLIASAVYCFLFSFHSRLLCNSLSR